MILHAASIAAFFVAQTPQAQYAVQCVQAAPGTWLDRLLYFLPQFMVSVIPVAGGVGIAWMAFRWNRKKERAQWVRDQKITEWRKLLECISEFDSLFPGYVSDLEGFYHNEEVRGKFLDKLQKNIDAINQCRLMSLVIASCISKRECREKFDGYIEDIRSNMEGIVNGCIIQKEFLKIGEIARMVKLKQETNDRYTDLRKTYEELRIWTLSLALSDLQIESEDMLNSN
jgi:hypothetical protein